MALLGRGASAEREQEVEEVEEVEEFMALFTAPQPRRRRRQRHPPNSRLRGLLDLLDLPFELLRLCRSERL